MRLLQPWDGGTDDGGRGGACWAVLQQGEEVCWSLGCSPGRMSVSKTLMSEQRD